jgi:hypothetical protein
MLRVHTLPGSLRRVLEAFRPCFTSPTFTTFVTLLAGLIAQPARRTVCGMLAGAGLAGVWLRRLPPHVTLTGPLRSNASLWHVHPDLDHPPRLRGRGRPRVYATRIGTPADLAATAPAISVTVTRYGRTSTIQVHHQRCLWRGVFGARPVRVLVIAEPGKPNLALVTTDPDTPSAGIVQRYAVRWAIEVAFEDAKQVTGVGEADNRTRTAVERTVPFGLYTQSIVIVWYHLAGHHPGVGRVDIVRWLAVGGVRVWGDQPADAVDPPGTHLRAGEGLEAAQHEPAGEFVVAQFP